MSQPVPSGGGDRSRRGGVRRAPEGGGPDPWGSCGEAQLAQTPSWEGCGCIGQGKGAAEGTPHAGGVAQRSQCNPGVARLSCLQPEAWRFWVGVRPEGQARARWRPGFVCEAEEFAFYCRSCFGGGTPTWLRWVAYKTPDTGVACSPN